MDPHQKALVTAAAALGIEVEPLEADWGTDAVRYRRGERSEIVVRGRIYSSLSAVAQQVCDHKHAAKALLRELGIPCPASFVLRAGGDRAALAEFVERRSPCVCKPLSGTEGRAVLLDVDRAQTALDHWRRHRRRHGPFLVEEQVAGRDLRIQAVGGEPVAACRREPASVSGDGVSTLSQLVAARDRLVRSQNPRNRLEPDAAMHELLRAQRLDLDAVPEVGRRVRLKKVSNLSQGGHAVDVTAELHPRYAQWVRAVSRRLRVRIFSLDAITDDPGRDPLEAAQVLELNARSQWLHHGFSERRRHDVATLILRDLFAFPSRGGEG